MLYTTADIINKDGKIEGIASTSVLDRQNESVNVEGWDLKNFKKAPRLLWAHDHNEPAIGKVTKINLDGEGKKKALKFQAVFQDVTDKAKAIKTLVEQGFINTFSVGFKPLEAEGDTITKQELLEISVVNVPANPEAMLLAYKSLDEAGFRDAVIDEILNKALGSSSLPTSDKDTWDGRGAINRMMEACGGKDNMDFGKFAKGFAWHDSANADTLGAYKLPFADMVNGTMTAVWGGVRAAMGALMGARGGVDIPEADRRGVYNLLSRYYKKMDKQPPEFKYFDERVSELESEVSYLKEQTELAVKGLKHLNPQRSKDEATVVRLSLSKVIVKAADKMLESKSPDLDMVKVIKRSSEMLIRSHKGDLHGSN